MAETLGITLDTVKKHVRNVIDKLQARSRTHAAIIAAQAGIVGNPIAHIHYLHPKRSRHKRCCKQGNGSAANICFVLWHGFPSLKIGLTACRNIT